MFFLFTFPFYFLMQASSQMADVKQGIPGTYMLRGVPETAAGFRFAPDSTFEFFISYGAVDRIATGTYSQKDGTVILKGNKIPGKDFTITKSRKQGKGITLQVNNPNSILKERVICYFHKNGQSEIRYTDKNGICNYPEMPDSIKLIHPFFADEPTLLLPSTFSSGHNYLELEIAPSAEQLCFLEVPIQIIDQKFSCKIPWIFDQKVVTFYLSEKE
jgi:hypothetical protein